MEVLRQIHFQALEPPMIEALIELIDRDLGYHLYASIEQSKCALSETSSTRFWFSEGTLNIEELLSQDQFEAWIQPQIEQINSSISPAPHQCSVPANDINAVYMTGGTSFVPIEEFTSVAEGLALLHWSLHEC